MLKRLREILLDIKILGRRSRVEFLLLFWFFLKRNYYKKKILVYKLFNYFCFIRFILIFSINVRVLFCFWFLVMNFGNFVLKIFKINVRLRRYSFELNDCWILNDYKIFLIIIIREYSL